MIKKLETLWSALEVVPNYQKKFLKKLDSIKNEELKKIILQNEILALEEIKDQFQKFKSEENKRENLLEQVKKWSSELDEEKENELINKIEEIIQDIISTSIDCPTLYKNCKKLNNNQGI